MFSKDFYIEKGSKKIYSRLFLPVGISKFPLVIFAHGLGASHRHGLDYASRLVGEGYGFLVFDFCGGGYSSKSSGSTLDMSVLTEGEDLVDVIEYCRTLNCVDDIFLIGASQGGFASILASSKTNVSGLILLYPALVIRDDIHDTFSSLSNVPVEFNYKGWINLSKVYASDVWDLDIYSYIKKYSGDVLIIHGDCDGLVPLKYSIKAHELYPSSSLKVIKGAGHGFYGGDMDNVLDFILEYLSKF